jgi:hypothetical protein
LKALVEMLPAVVELKAPVETPPPLVFTWPSSTLHPALIARV